MDLRTNEAQDVKPSEHDTMAGVDGFADPAKLESLHITILPLK
jgi:hypothetical protein